MPAVAAAFIAFVVGAVLGMTGWSLIAVVASALAAAAFYFRLGTPRGTTIDLDPPLTGRWQALNSPTSRLPSHHLHAWSQTYALDLVADPTDGSRPAASWWPLARRPQDFPAFGRSVLAPTDGVIVRAFDAARDHWSRTSVPGLVYLLAESLRELAGPVGILGNHVVVRRDDGAHVLIAHLQRRSLVVERGDRVRRGQAIARCGNSGNSTEPHVHIQAMDQPSVWVAAALPMSFRGDALPPNGEHLDVPERVQTPAG